MYLFQTLEKYQKGINFRKSEDYYFYLDNRHLFNTIEMYKFLLDAKNEFDVIRANIVIRAIQNKQMLDKSILYAYKESQMTTESVPEFIHEQMAGRPYIQDGIAKIYVPIFSRAINTLYFSNFGKLLKDPYAKLLERYDSSCIDLFETYSFSLYDSLFTKLVTVYKSEIVMVVYHFDFHSLYVINDQGRLDAKIALFDKYLKHPGYNHMIERTKDVIECYLDGDKEGMFKAMVENKLISEKLIYKIKHKDFRFNRSLERKAK